MLRKGKWKFITYYGLEEMDLLFNMEEDPHEVNNVIDSNPYITEGLKNIAYINWDPKHIIERHKIIVKNWEILDKWGRVTQPEESDIWQITEKRLEPPTK